MSNRKLFIDKKTNQYIKTTDLTNKKFNKFTILEFDHMRRTKHASKAYWLVSCECGNKKVRDIQLIKSGRIKSCGCSPYIKENSKDKLYGLHNPKRFKTYTSWNRMINRCTNSNAPQYKYYGGRGINVCNEWLDFIVFLEEMGDRPENTTLDRIDVNKGYSKNNCRWADSFQQSVNKTNTRYVNYNGEILSLKECVSKYSKNRYDTVWNRLKSGWTLENALKVKPNRANMFIINCLDFMDEDQLSEYIYK